MGKTPEPKDGDNVSAAARILGSYVDRIERLNEEKKGLGDDIKEIYGECKSKGYDTKVLKDIIRRRKMKRDDLDAYDATLATYETALDSILG